MQKWKFLLYGITGDLAKKKILPALAQFAFQNQNTVAIELIGYSRSQPDPVEISTILRENTPDRNHWIHAISFLQGEYLSPDTYFNIIRGLQDDERLITYLATPPHTFLKILQNSCPYSHRPIDIIMEKPFGENLTEAQHILDVVRVCDLGSHVHFCDHYLFKTSANPNPIDAKNFAEIRHEQLNKITVKIAEFVDVAGRGGYYDSIGAFKDMFIHTFSLAKIGLEFYTTQANIDFDSFVVKNFKHGQYSGYCVDAEVEKSQTDTYFKVNGEIMVNGKPVLIQLASGKRLKHKQTEVEMSFLPGDVLHWELAPQQFITRKQTDSNLQINLDKSKNLDHTNLFEDMLNGSEMRFVQPAEIITSWNMYDKILKFVKENPVELEIY